VDPCEIVVHEVEGDSGGVVLQLLGEGIGQARETSHRHSHGEVLALDIGGRDVFRVRVT